LAALSPLAGSVASGADSAAAGDAVAGQALFVGARRMQNGGAACGACHAVGGHGAALAGSLGPELSRSFEGLPPDAVDGILQDLPFPTMAPIYAGHALTPQERADLAAFLIGATGAAPPRGAPVAAWAAAVAVALVLLTAIAARRRKGSTRSRLCAHPPAPERPALVGSSHERPASAGTARAAASGGGTR
jgi:mono/diheme cytochrome c family protein